MSKMTAQEHKNEAAEIVARAGRYYRNTRYLIFVIFFGFGLWCIRDGFFQYPRANDEAIKEAISKVEAARGTTLSASERAEVMLGTKLPHGGYDVPMNRGLGVLLPPLAVIVLIWTLRNSRGEYRLAGETLHIPGHGAIPLSAIRKIDKRRWERKGIACIEYEVFGSTEMRRFRLDDFVYERKPTDEIFEKIEDQAGHYVEGGGEEKE